MRPYRHPFLGLRGPEWTVALFSFLLHFVWEMLQTPFFNGMPEMPHWPATVFCLQATLGDVVIALSAFSTTAMVVRNRRWFLAPSIRDIAIYLAVGIAATIALELHAVYYVNRWAYAPQMPLIPVLKVGLIPVLQWIVVPFVVLWLARQHHQGGQSVRASIQFPK
jgi:hypothetical protein